MSGRAAKTQAGIRALAERLEVLVRSGVRRTGHPGLPMSLSAHLSRVEKLYRGTVAEMVGAV